MIDKKAVSLMISYVILVSIVIAMSIAVFGWLKVIANVEPLESCGDGTSLIIQEYQCSTNTFSLSLKNNGRFNIDGFALTVGDELRKVPYKTLSPKDVKLKSGGAIKFKNTLGPKEENLAIFNSGTLSKIVKLSIQPFIIDDETGQNVFCGNAIISQNIDGCFFTGSGSIGSTGPSASPPIINGGKDDITKGNNNFIHQWKFDGNLKDSKGNADFSKVTGSNIKYVEGYSGKAIQLDIDDKLGAPKGKLSDLSDNEITISFWLKNPSQNKNRLLEKRVGGKGFQIKTYPDKIEFLAGTSSWTICTVKDGYFNDWRKVILTANKDTGKKIYLGNTLCKQSDSNTVTNDLNLDVDLKLGLKNNFEGEIDELTIWDKDLS